VININKICGGGMMEILIGVLLYLVAVFFICSIFNGAKEQQKKWDREFEIENEKNDVGI